MSTLLLKEKLRHATRPQRRPSPPKSQRPGLRGEASPERRRLADLISIGPAMLRDFKLLGIRSVQELSRRSPEKLYEQLVARRGPQDICVLDVFRCAVAQARDPRLPAAQCQWWYYSRLRKSTHARPC